MTLPAEEFLRRFLQHVLPRGFQKVRAYGFLSPNAQRSLEAVRWLATLHARATFVLHAAPAPLAAPPPCRVPRVHHAGLPARRRQQLIHHHAVRERHLAHEPQQPMPLQGSPNT